jgi:hypothetical protein
MVSPPCGDIEHEYKYWLKPSVAWAKSLVLIFIKPSSDCQHEHPIFENLMDCPLIGSRHGDATGAVSNRAPHRGAKAAELT